MRIDGGEACPLQVKVERSKVRVELLTPASSRGKPNSDSARLVFIFSPLCVLLRAIAHHSTPPLSRNQWFESLVKRATGSFCRAHARQSFLARCAPVLKAERFRAFGPPASCCWDGLGWTVPLDLLNCSGSAFDHGPLCCLLSFKQPSRFVHSRHGISGEFDLPTAFSTSRLPTCGV